MAVVKGSMEEVVWMKLTFKEFLHWPKYAHYLLLTGIVFYIHYLSGIWGIEAMTTTNAYTGYPILFVFYAAGLLIGDTILHLVMGIFHKDDEPNYNNQLGGKRK